MRTWGTWEVCVFIILLQYSIFSLFARFYRLFFLDKILAIKRIMTPHVTAMSAILKIAKYHTDIISVTDPNRLRSRALRNHPVKIKTYPILSFFVKLRHDFITNISNALKINGIRMWIPGSGVLNAIPVFFIWVSSTHFQSIEISGSRECDHHFVEISAIDVSNMIINIFMHLYNTRYDVFSKYKHKSLIFLRYFIPLKYNHFLMPTIVLACDHAGFIFRWPVKHFLEKVGYIVLDVGPEKIDEWDDFPDYANIACGKILNGEAEKWVLICGTGIGMSLAANRHKGIRAVLGYSPVVAEIARTHNNANIICFGARTMELVTVLASLEVFLKTDFLWGKYQGRNEKLDV